MKLINKILMAAVISAGISTSCYAADLDIKLLNRNVQISSGMSEGDFASIWVLNPDVTKEEFSATEFIDFSMAAYCNQMKLTEDNQIFDFDMYEKAPTGVYTAIIGGKGTNVRDTFEYVSKDDLNGYISTINSSGAEQISTLLNNDTFADTALLQLGVDKDILKTLDTDSKKTEYFRIMLSQKPFTAANIADLAEKANIIYKVNKSENKYGEISSVLNAFGAVPAYKEMYESMADVQSEFNSCIINKLPFTDVDGAYSTILESIALCKLNTTRWENINDTLAGYSEYFKLVYNGNFTTLSANVAKTIASYNFTTLSEVQTVFNNAIYSDAILVPQAPSSGGGGGGGGGSSVVKPSLNTDVLPSGNTSALPFNDLGSVEWAKDSILRLYEKKIVNGDGNGNFNPNDNVTREQFAAMLIRALEIETTNAECDFSDINKDDWSYAYVAAAFKNGIVTGMNTNTFGYGTPIIRQDIAVMAERAVKLAGKELADSECAFGDTGDISDYAVTAVGKLSGVKIINGMDGNVFAPKKNATRAEAAKIICGILDLINEREAQ
ncbi:MAG: S-layer homology domain-containing protein [Clostridia bacterium]|nr:S-layer homology domain-containing protein [Clostridia bacterium]